MFVFWVWDALAGYWVWDASLLDALRAIGYGRLDGVPPIGYWTLRYWTPCGLLAMGDGRLGIGNGRWDAS